MNNKFMINYFPGTTFFHKLNGKTKVIAFIIMMAFVIMTLDIRVMLVMFILSVITIISMKPNWKPLLFILSFMFVTSGLITSIMIILIRPVSGLQYVGGANILFQFNEHFYITKELLWYVSVMFFKRLTSLMVSLVLILSITPSELAAGLNGLGLPYKICTIVSLAFRTIPDIARDFTDIKNSMMLRGVELDSKRVNIFTKLRQTTLILIPLIMTSLGRVENIANAMDLRGFGKLKKRSWYIEHKPTKADWIIRLVTLGFALFCVYYVVFHKILVPYKFDYWCPWIS